MTIIAWITLGLIPGFLAGALAAHTRQTVRLRYCTQFTLLVKWSDEEAHTAHFSTKLIQNAMAFLPILLSDELDLYKRALRLDTIRYGTNSYCLAVC